MGGRILLAEDNDDLRRLLVMHISSMGYEVIEARDGEEAWGLNLEYRPDLIVTDINMPRMSGIDLIRLVRQFDSDHQVPIVVMSAYDSGYLTEAMQAGADYRLHKPEDLDRLEELIKHMLQSKSLDPA
jgi:CheY-like chemotaxis protein